MAAAAKKAARAKADLAAAKKMWAAESPVLAANNLGTKELHQAIFRMAKAKIELGITNFELFLLELRAERVTAKLRELSAEELVVVKRAWKEAEAGAIVAEAGDKLLEELNRIKNLRKSDFSKRIEELGKDLDKSGISLTEGKAGAEIEEAYGYFERFRSTQSKKGDWISISGPFKGCTFDEFGGSLGQMALNEFARKPKQKAKFFESIDLHFTKADYVVLNLSKVKRLQPILYQETLNYISSKFGTTKLINISK